MSREGKPHIWKSRGIWLVSEPSPYDVSLDQLACEFVFRLNGY